MLENNWKKFVEETKNRKPNGFLVEAVEKLNATEGFALDLGCGAGVDAKYLAENGFKVEAVDSSEDAIKQTKNICKGLPVLAVQKNIIDFVIEPNKYSLIIAWNSLPFLSKEEAKEIFLAIKNGLKPCGFFIFSVFGPDDDWAKTHTDMSFWTIKEIKRTLSETEFIKIVEKKKLAHP